MIVVAWLNKTSFFICGSGIWLKFSRIEHLLKRLQLGSKTDLTTSGLISKFFLKYASFRHRQICADWQKQELLVYVCLWGHEVPSRINFTCFPICTLFVLEDFRLINFRKPIYELYQWTNFFSLIWSVFWPFCLASKDEHFFLAYFQNPVFRFQRFFSLLFVSRSSNPFTAVSVFRRLKM